MEKLIIKNILDNSYNINVIKKNISKCKIITGISFIFAGIVTYSLSSIIHEHEEKINDLQIEIEEMKSKGE